MPDSGLEIKALDGMVLPGDPFGNFIAIPVGGGRWKFGGMMDPDMTFGIVPGETGSGNPVVVGHNLNSWTLHPKGTSVYVLQAENSDACMNLRNGRESDTDICIWGGDWTQVDDNSMWVFELST